MLLIKFLIKANSYLFHEYMIAMLNNNCIIIKVKYIMNNIFVLFSVITIGAEPYITTNNQIVIKYRGYAYMKDQGGEDVDGTWWSCTKKDSPCPGMIFIHKGIIDDTVTWHNHPPMSWKLKNKT